MSDDELDRRLRVPAEPHPGPHPDDEALLAWVRGQTDDLDDHLAACAECRVLTRAMRQADRRPPLGEVAPRAAQGTLQPRWRRARWGSAAGLVAAAAGLVLVLGRAPVAPAFEVEEVSRGVASVRGATTGEPTEPRYPANTELVLRLRGDGPVGDTAEVRAELAVLDTGGALRVVPEVRRLDHGAVIELRTLAARVATASTGPQIYYVVVTADGRSVDGRMPEQLGASTRLWKRSLVLQRGE
jgi:hypothetical protein